MGIVSSSISNINNISNIINPLPPLHNAKVVLEIQGISINLQSDGICKCIPPIYQFKPKTDDEPQLKWKPFQDPSTLPNSVSWSSKETKPDILTTSQGPKISYKIWVNDNYLLQSGNDVNVTPLSTGGSWSEKRQTLVFRKGYYYVDGIQFEYKDEKLLFSYFSWQESN